MEKLGIFFGIDGPLITGGRGYFRVNLRAIQKLIRNFELTKKKGVQHVNITRGGGGGHFATELYVHEQRFFGRILRVFLDQKLLFRGSNTWKWGRWGLKKLLCLFKVFCLFF